MRTVVGIGSREFVAAMKDPVCADLYAVAYKLLNERNAIERCTSPEWAVAQAKASAAFKVARAAFDTKYYVSI